MSVFVRAGLLNVLETILYIGEIYLLINVLYPNQTCFPARYRNW